MINIIIFEKQVKIRNTSIIYYLYFSKIVSLYFFANLFSIPRAEIVSIFLKLVFMSYDWKEKKWKDEQKGLLFKIYSDIFENWFKSSLSVEIPRN